MKEKDRTLAVKAEDMRCSNCNFGHQIVAVIGGGDIEEDGTENKWVLMREIPIGQTRNCFSSIQHILGTAGEKFIYPDENDTCIKRKKFKPKKS